MTHRASRFIIVEMSVILTLLAKTPGLSISRLRSTRVEPHNHNNPPYIEHRLKVGDFQAPSPGCQHMYHQIFQRKTRYLGTVSGVLSNA